MTSHTYGRLHSRPGIDASNAGGMLAVSPKVFSAATAFCGGGGGSKHAQDETFFPLRSPRGLGGLHGLPPTAGRGRNMPGSLNVREPHTAHLHHCRGTDAAPLDCLLIAHL